MLFEHYLNSKTNRPSIFTLFFLNPPGGFQLSVPTCHIRSLYVCFPRSPQGFPLQAFLPMTFTLTFVGLVSALVLGLSGIFVPGYPSGI